MVKESIKKRNYFISKIKVFYRGNLPPPNPPLFLK